MFENLLVVAGSAMVLWLGSYAYYLYTSKQQQDVAKEIRTLENMLDVSTGNDDEPISVHEVLPVDEAYDESEQKYLSEVHKLVTKGFDKEELKTLCFNVGVDYDDLRGEGKINKARELVMNLKRQDRIADLKREVSNARPETSWPDKS